MSYGFNCKLLVFLIVIGFLSLLTFFQSKEGFYLKEVGFNDLPGYKKTQVLNLYQPLKKSCEKIDIGSDNFSISKLSGYRSLSDYKSVCSRLSKANIVNEEDFKQFIENNFKPHLVINNGLKEALFTGYFIPVVKGSLHKTKKYTIPVLDKPSNLVEIDNLAELVKKPELEGVRASGYVKNGKLLPYLDRESIERDYLNGVSHANAWVENIIDLFFAQIQGSFLLKTDKELVQLAYNGTNGRSYQSIGKILIDEGHIAKEDVSMQSIVSWLLAHPKEVKRVLNNNQSYVFFKLKKRV